jgi:hypothetical protein
VQDEKYGLALQMKFAKIDKKLLYPNYLAPINDLPDELRRRFEGIGEDTKMGSSGFIMAIGGGAALPALKETDFGCHRKHPYFVLGAAGLLCINCRLRTFNEEI